MVINDYISLIQRRSIRRIKSYRIALAATTGFAPGVDTIIGEMRNPPGSGVVCLVKHIRVAISTAAVATVVGAVLTAWHRVSAFTVDDTGGATGTPSKDDSTMAAAKCTVRHCTTAALAVGTRTPDANRLGGSAVSVRANEPATLVYELDLSRSPIVLRPGEGLEHVNRTALATSMTIVPAMQIEWSEIDEKDFLL